MRKWAQERPRDLDGSIYVSRPRDVPFGEEVTPASAFTLTFAPVSVSFLLQCGLEDGVQADGVDAERLNAIQPVRDTVNVSFTVGR